MRTDIYAFSEDWVLKNNSSLMKVAEPKNSQLDWYFLSQYNVTTYIVMGVLVTCMWASAIIFSFAFFGLVQQGLGCVILTHLRPMFPDQLTGL